MAIRTRENLIGYALVTPFLLFFAVFLLGPFIYSFWLSLHATNIYSDWYNRLGTMDYVGVGNYTDLLFHSAEFWWSMIVTVFYAVLTIPTMIALSLFLAILLSAPIVRLKGLFRTGFFVPQVLDLLVIGIIWSLLFTSPSGALDRLLRDLLGGLSVQTRTLLSLGAGLLLALGFAWVLNSWLRAKFSYEQRFASDFMPNLILLALTAIVAIPMLAVAWGFDRSVVQPFFGTGGREGQGLLANPVMLMPIIAVVMVLKGCGLGMILFLTTIQQIPRSVYEAAEVDGANARQRAFLITLPLVRPIILFLSITGLMATLNAFTEIYAMTEDKGGPPTEFAGETVQAGKLTGYLLWVSFREQYYGRAAALSFILMAFALIISLINVRLLGSRAE